MNHELIDHVGSLCQAPEYTKRTGDESVLGRFHAQFPADKLDQMTLETYCLGKGSQPENFSWWIERGLEPSLGRYMPGTSRGHLAYKRKDGLYYFHRHLVDLDETEAMSYIAKVHQFIAKANTKEEMLALDDDNKIYEALGLEPRIVMGQGRKLRVLAIYHPDAVLPISSHAHLKYFLLKFGVEESDVPKGIIARCLRLFEIYEAIRDLFPVSTVAILPG